jgi:response regulator RpfG family c-di-GMP phosphodiesterase
MPGGAKILERLFHEERVDAGQYQQVIQYAHQAEQRVEDALVATGAMSEDDLLKYLANVYKTRFVSTRKLAKANIAAQTLRLVPRRVAEKLTVFPVLFEPRSHSLSIVVADPATEDVAKQVQLASGVRDVKVYIALPGSIRRAIRKHYDGQVDAFAGDAGQPAVLDVDERKDHFGYGFSGDEWPTGASSGAAPPEPAKRPATPVPPPGPTLSIDAPDIAASLRGAVAEPAAEAEPQSPSPSAVSPAPSTSSGPGWESYLETLNVMVALLEQNRGELRGHTSQVARGCRKMCERLGLPAEETSGILVAAYLHDLGKASTYHLTPLNVAQYEGHAVQARKTFQTPLRMLEAAGLPDETKRTLWHMYERVNGQGFPDRLSGKDIPRGARILAIAETYFDLTTHAKNPFRRKLSAKEACDALDQSRDDVFDGNLVDVWRRVVLGDDLKQRLLSKRSVVLLVDPDPEETTVLEMRLVDAGFDVVIARNASDARERLLQGDVDALITEVELTPDDGFQLVERIGAEFDAPVLFLTRRGDRTSVQRGFELGAADYLVKPASAEVVTAKTTQLLERERRREQGGGARGVTGSLTEMALPDVIQILANGRKSGRLTVVSKGRRGEIHFGEGAIYDARFGDLRGEEAFYQILVLTEGDFELDPTFRPQERAIHASTESLLLEGMRRWDESQVAR